MKSSLVVLAFACAFLASVGHAASGLKSIEECNLALRDANPWERSYKIEGSRLDGVRALAKVQSMKNVNAVSEKTVDSLGVERYETLTLTTALETQGTSKSSCEGVSTANEVQICTSNGIKAACEIRCEMTWVGADCR